tara:strand:- start:388 stop:867 length:480 start_codon:yes stop_codon:yes gene_type:complete
MKRKTLFIIGGVAILGVGAFLAFRKKTLRFYDNVWCTGSECNNIEEDFNGAEGYIDYTTQNAPFIAQSGGVENAYTSTDSSSSPVRSQGNNTGNLNLLFKKPHGLKAGDEIYIKQDEGATYDSYNGQTFVAEVYTDYIIRTNKARMGSTPVEGGEVIVL